MSLRQVNDPIPDDRIAIGPWHVPEGRRAHPAHGQGPGSTASQAPPRGAGVDVTPNLVWIAAIGLRVDPGDVHTAGLQRDHEEDEIPPQTGQGEHLDRE